MRRADVWVTVAGEVAPAEIVAEDDEEVGARRGAGGKRGGEGEHERQEDGAGQTETERGTHGDKRRSRTAAEGAKFVGFRDGRVEAVSGSAGHGSRSGRAQQEAAGDGVPGIVGILAGEDEREPRAVVAQPLPGEIPMEGRGLDMPRTPRLLVGDGGPRTPGCGRVEEAELAGVGLAVLSGEEAGKPHQVRSPAETASMFLNAVKAGVLIASIPKRPHSNSSG